ncbi:MAG: nicotinate-nucleotide adenylyltransferase [Acidobacteriota bacterium]
MNGRIGAYGGTFDPIHLGHLEIARAVAERFRLDEMLIIPAHCPPHKTAGEVSKPFHRYAMAVLATADDARLKVSTIEMEMPERPYTFQTIERLYGIYGADAKLFFVMGADSFADIMKWREPEQLLSAVSIVVAARPGTEVETSHLPERFRSRVRPPDEAGEDEHFIYLTSYVERDLSSREIRRCAREGLSIREMVPRRVADYIEKYGLYEQG